MSLFAKFMRNQDSEIDAVPSEQALPNHFDMSRRTSVSAECWPEEQGIYSPAALKLASAGDSSRTAVIGASGARATGENASASATATQLSGGRRGSVAEPENALGTPNGADASGNCVPAVPGSHIDKNAYMRASKALRSTIFFSELSDDLMQQLLLALRVRREGSGVTVIQQGDEGNELFILDEGRVEFIRDGERVGEASGGSTFGELALLYNSQRAATVRTLEACCMYTLDRRTFKRIMVAKLSRKRVHSQRVLASIDVFAHLPEATQLRIADALHPVTYHRGDTVIKQGDSGSEFFVIDEGTVDISIDGKVVGNQGPGSYFGELALIYDLPRAATITATSEHLKVEVLSSRGFEHLIGPELVAELRKRDPRS